MDFNTKKETAMYIDVIGGLKRLEPKYLMEAEKNGN